jgi:hypothetical protein
MKIQQEKTMQRPDSFRPERKEHIVNFLQELVISCDQKKEMYNDIIYHCTEMMEGQIPSSDILPEKDDILRHIKFQRKKQETKKNYHERLLEVVQALYTTEDNHEEGDEDLRSRHSMTAEDIMELHGISTKKKLKHEGDH